VAGHTLNKETYVDRTVHTGIIPVTLCQ